MPVSRETLDEIALTESEYQLIVDRLDREPNPVELGMFGALWSEHCGYKHSKALLRLFPSSSPRLLVAPGAENAGAVDIGHGLAIVMKIESHNHPSAIEPYQGAATGVGGIVRDIFTMGARPIAILNSLRFGPLSDARNRHLFEGVVAGISGYGNCLGIPNVGGEVGFSPSYAENPLVNAMCVGLVQHDGIVSAIAEGPGNTLMIVGADTGRDGIHGASGLASRTFEEDRELRSTVQVGNPFLEKCLLEACLQLAKGDAIVGMQDLGAAGLTSSAVESARRGATGLFLDLARVPRREQGMTPYEVMLSESQERMLVVVKRGREAEVRELFERWDLHSEVIGSVTGDGVARIFDGDTAAAAAPIDILTDAPEYRPESRRPDWLEPLQSADLSALPEWPGTWSGILLRVLGSANIRSKESVFRQYDHQVMDDTVVPPGGDAAVIRIRGTPMGIALTTDGNGRQCYVEPYQGGALAVTEAARNLACVGARPVAITDGLNFGNPERPDVYYQMEECVKGMSAACRALSLPVISGNVSLYNESRGEAIYPTPIVGALGILDDIEKRCTAGFKEAGDLVLLLGDPSQDSATLGGSEYLEVIHGRVEGKVTVDLDLERRVQAACLQAIGQGCLASAHDCSEGGLLAALAESAILGEIGFSGSWPIEARRDAAYFGEAPSRIVLSIDPARFNELQSIAEGHRVKLTRLGIVGGERFKVSNDLDLHLVDITAAWRGALETQSSAAG